MDRYRSVDTDHIADYMVDDSRFVGRDQCELELSVTGMRLSRYQRKARNRGNHNAGTKQKIGFRLGNRFLYRCKEIISLLVDNTTLFDASFLSGKSAQVIKFGATHFTILVNND